MWRYKAVRAWLRTSGGQLLNYKTFRMKVIKCNPGFPQHVTRYKQLDASQWVIWNTLYVCDKKQIQINDPSFAGTPVTCDWDKNLDETNKFKNNNLKNPPWRQVTVQCYTCVLYCPLSMWCAVQRREDTITKLLLLNTVTVYDMEK